MGDSSFPKKKPVPCPSKEVENGPCGLCDAIPLVGGLGFSSFLSVHGVYLVIMKITSFLGSGDKIVRSCFLSWVDGQDF